MKICYTCKKEKEVKEYNVNNAKKDGLSHNCRLCDSEIRKIKYREIPEDIKKLKHIGKYKRNELALSKKKEYYLKNKEKILENRKKYQTNNKEKIQEYRADFYSLNKEKILEDRKEYYNNNKEKIIKKIVSYEMNRRRNDEYYRIFKNIKCRFRNALKSYTINGKVKSCKEYGINFKEIYANLGDAPGEDYHIDHIIPLSMFDLTNNEHVALAYSHHNLRWLESKANISKNNKLIDEVFTNEHLSKILEKIQNKQGV